jgi:hypothetical protein
MTETLAKIRRDNPTVAGPPKADEALKRAKAQQDDAPGPDATGHPLYNPTTNHGGPPDTLPIGQSEEQPDPAVFGTVADLPDSVVQGAAEYPEEPAPDAPAESK